MKRIQLFEFEDFSWFPNWIRICLTRLILVMHKFLKSSDDLSDLVSEALKHSEQNTIVDLCSGSGGPMIDVFTTLKEKPETKDLKLILTDLYPNLELAKKINDANNTSLQYNTNSVDASEVDHNLQGVRTMICSFHHMNSETAKKILQDAQSSGQPICIYEISDNSLPNILWWIALPLNFVMTFFITPFVKPLSWKQIVFTYFIPILPFFFAWDGAVSNVRTYTVNDLDELTKDLQSENYIWKKGILKGKAKKIYLLGLPKKGKQLSQ